ncbi:MAG: long-chain fatty acid--CoA ligase [Ignavibacteriales bacterium]|nr:long-chain fatty acid--CoA ligase [Ignavibacteriales bacterium]
MSLAVPFSTIPEMFFNITNKYADIPRPMLTHKLDGKWATLTFSEVREMVELVTGGFAALGITNGDRVSLISENRPEWVMCDQALAALGAISVPLYPTMTAKQIEDIFLDADVSYAIVSNASQLKKVLPLLEKINSLRKIVVFTDKELPMHENVISLIQLIASGETFLDSHKHFYEKQVQQITPDHLLTLIYTSGTTGTPKGAMLTNGNIVSNIKSATKVLPISADDVFLSFLPLCHSFERMAGYYTAVGCGASIAYAESIETVRDSLVEIQPTIMTAVPRFFERVYNRIMKQVSESPPLKQKIFFNCLDIGKRYAKGKRLQFISRWLKVKHRVAHRLVFQKLQEKTGGHIRFFVSGGGPLAKEYGEFFEAVGIPIIEGYGLTESSPVLSVNHLDRYKFGTVGFPIPGVEIKIVDDGEILARGPNIMKGYWNDELSTRKAIDENGWLHTGDIGEFDKEGFLKITDRKKHLFVSSGGKNIAPQPIENRFLMSKYIDQFVLIGDARMFLSALIVPDIESLEEIARTFNLSYRMPSDLIQREEIRNFFWNEIQQLQTDVPNYERVRKFALLDHALTVENGEITPTMKIRRKVVEEKYKDLIEEIYSEVR